MLWQLEMLPLALITFDGNVDPIPPHWHMLGFGYNMKSSLKKNLINKNQGWEPIHQKYKANDNTSRHNPKKKQKQTINKIQIKTFAKRTHGNKTTINNNKENLRQKNCHLPQID
jgi:hypothetical protein